MERLTERDSYWLGEEFWTSAKEPDDKEIDNVYAKLKEYEDLEEQGLLIRLPCKVGDTVWEVDTIELYCDEYHITNINITEHGIVLENSCMGFGFNIEDIGKTIFLTKEEAERALEEIEE